MICALFCVMGAGGVILAAILAKVVGDCCEIIDECDQILEDLDRIRKERGTYGPE